MDLLLACFGHFEEEYPDHGNMDHASDSGISEDMDPLTQSSNFINIITQVNARQHAQTDESVISSPPALASQDPKDPSHQAHHLPCMSLESHSDYTLSPASLSPDIRLTEELGNTGVLWQETENSPQGQQLRGTPQEQQSLEAGFEHLINNKGGERLSAGFPDECLHQQTGVSLKTSAQTQIQVDLENLMEFNGDIEKLLKEANKILNKGIDSSIKNFRVNLHEEIQKISGLSRKSRNSIKIQARNHLPLLQAENIIRHPILTANVELLKEAKSALHSYHEQIEERGLNLTRKDSSSVSWPTFCGESLPLVHEYLQSLERLMVETGIPMSERGNIIMKTTSGRARHILAICKSNLNTSYQELSDILTKNFGSTEKQMKIIQHKHISCGRIPNIYDNVQPPEILHMVARDHLIIFEATESLYKRYLAKDVIENPMSGKYIQLLENHLPRNAMMDLADQGYLETMNHHQRFRSLKEAYKRIEGFSLYLITKQDYPLMPLTFNPKVLPPLKRVS